MDSKVRQNTELLQRIDLAACYRLIDLYDMSDGIGTHISARVPDTDDDFLINPYGWMFDEITASSLVRVDGKGYARGGSMGSGGEYPVNPAAFNLHSCIYEASRDAQCVLHTHSEAGIALAAQQEGLLPLSQHGMQFYDRIGYHAYEGLVTNPVERPRFVADLGQHQALILHNHGLVTIGTSVAEAFYMMWRLEKACRTQLLALATGSELVLPEAEVASKTSAVYAGSSAMMSEFAWEGFVRRLDRINPGYAD
ncbi:MAG: class II aldolase/adducin family protein [Gammaproteobacteria bacterium]|jgi:ribulose-5-phosphate 4-epimerase/fuculose-1-phosphate aldolase|nr:class II aldolase/adducin family protein [Gammaproteobacteria bacterium]